MCLYLGPSNEKIKFVFQKRNYKDEKVLKIALFRKLSSKKIPSQRVMNVA